MKTSLSFGFFLTVVIHYKYFNASCFLFSAFEFKLIITHHNHQSFKMD